MTQRGYIVVTILGGSVSGERFNGQYSYYHTERGIEVFLSRADAQAVVELESSWSDTKYQVLSVEMPEEARSAGVAVCKWAKRVCDKSGYYPSVRLAREKLLELLGRQEQKEIRQIREQAGIVACHEPTGS